MTNIGFFTLGAAAAASTGLILARVKVPASVGSCFIALLPIVLSGIAVFSNTELSRSNSADFYGIGLLASLMWQKTNASISNLEKLQWLPYAQSVIGIICTAGIVFLALAKLHV